MGNRKVPDRAEAKVERFRHLIVERFTSDPRLALEHSQSRNGRVAEALCYMALLRDPARLVRPLPAPAIVTCEEAEQQFFSAPGGPQAAHLLPGQILVGQSAPWEFLQGIAAQKFKNLFGYVEPLHPNFNKADSAAEEKGLADAFAAACQRVLAGTAAPERDIGEAYGRVWVPGARAAFAAAAAQKRTKPAPPKPIFGEAGTPDYNTIMNPEELGAGFADESMWNIHEQLSILDYYNASLDSDPPQLRPQAVAEILATPA